VRVPRDSDSFNQPYVGARPMIDVSIDVTRELCDDIDNLLELARQKRAPIRAMTLIELARADLQARLDEMELLGLSGKE
jgi:hypothetical protein